MVENKFECSFPHYDRGNDAIKQKKAAASKGEI